MRYRTGNLFASVALLAFDRNHGAHAGRRPVVIHLFVTIALLGGLLAAPAAPLAAATLLTASFGSSTDGFTYQDDPFASPYNTSQPVYASGAGSRRAATAARRPAGDAGRGRRQRHQRHVRRLDATRSTWQQRRPGVASPSATSWTRPPPTTFDEYSRVLVKVDGVQYGRGREELRRSHRRRRLEHAGQQQHASCRRPTGSSTRCYLGNLAPGATPSSWAATTTRRTPRRVDDGDDRRRAVTSGNAAPAADRRSRPWPTA